MMAENPDNEWSTDRRALSLFRFITAILFFGTPFRGIHDWFQSDLPMHAKKLVLIVRDDVFWGFRKDNSVLEELSQDFLNKCHRYGKPNVGYFWEKRFSNVGKIIGDKAIQPIISLPDSLLSEIAAKNKA
jgi:hypothetical protein